jgi:glycosyltransferase involved in cell wall biosynthesis
MSGAGLPTYSGQLRVTIAHDFLEAFGGAERVLQEMLQAFPGADLWTIAGRHELLRRLAPDRPTHAVLPESPLLLRHFRLLTPAYPAIVRAARLPPSDVLLTSSYAFANAFRTRNRAPQVCFCHSPLRFAWSATDEYRDRWAKRSLSRTAFGSLAAAMRPADRSAARRVAKYLTCSTFVADQIRRFYDKEPQMVNAPVDVERFHPGTSGHDDYFLFFGRLIEPYKRPTAVVEAFASLPNRRLVMAGDGPEMPRLKARATKNVSMVGQLADDELIGLIQRCTAVIFPSRDDFGLVPLEAMACGRPVIALSAGGALDTVEPGRTGELLAEATPHAIAQAVKEFDPDAFDSGEIRAVAERWDRRVFRRQLIDAVVGTAASSV